MSNKQYLIFLAVLITLSIVVVRCTPQENTVQLSAESEDLNLKTTSQLTPMQETEPLTNTHSITSETVTPSLTVTPLVEAETSQPGTMPSGDAQIAGNGSNDPDMLDEIDPTSWQEFTDDIFHFSTVFPPYFTIKILEDAELAQLSPEPLAAIYFQDQRKELVELAPPDFSIRIFDNKEGVPTGDWLETVGLINREAGWVTQLYQGKDVSGVKVISPDFMAPGWFVYVNNGNQIFQLTPLGVEAELMLEMFKFTK